MKSLAAKLIDILEAEPPKDTAIICDLDGCLAPNEPRQKFVDDDDWDAYHKSGTELPPAPWCLELVKKFATDHKILFVSARPGEYYDATMKWLEDDCGLPTESFDLFLKSDDTLQDTEFKAKCYQEEIRDKYDVTFVIDDRPRVVDVWRQLGLICLQPNFIDH